MPLITYNVNRNTSGAADAVPLQLWVDSSTPTIARHLAVLVDSSLSTMPADLTALVAGQSSISAQLQNLLGHSSALVAGQSSVASKLDTLIARNSTLLTQLTAMAANSSLLVAGQASVATKLDSVVARNTSILTAAESILARNTSMLSALANTSGTAITALQALQAAIAPGGPQPPSSAVPVVPAYSGILGVSSAVITSSAVQQIIVAASASQFHTLTGLIVANTGAQGCLLTVAMNGSAFTSTFVVPVPRPGSSAGDDAAGAYLSLPSPIRQTAANKSIAVQTDSSGVSVTVSAFGYTGA